MTDLLKYHLIRLLGYFLFRTLAAISSARKAAPIPIAQMPPWITDEACCKPSDVRRPHSDSSPDSSYTGSKACNAQCEK